MRLEIPESRSDRNHLGLFARILNVFGWNLAVSVFVGVLFWWFIGHGAPRQIWVYCKITLIYCNTYGFLMGLSMPYIGPRLGAFRRPWAWALIVVSLLLLTAVGSLIVGFIFTATGYYAFQEFWPRFAGNTAVGSVISLIIGLSISAYENIREKFDRTTAQLRAQELEKERALKLASEARLASLESRLHPHFLFNTLNSISALIREDPVRAESMLLRLAALLRFSLDAGSRRLLPLAQEMKIVADYLEIEKERLGVRLAFKLDVPRELEDWGVPPLSVQTLVENSVKHAISPHRAGGSIRVRAFPRNGNLLIEVWDSGQGFDPELIAEGRGIDNLQARLQTMFGDTAALSFHSDRKGSIVTVLLPESQSEVVEVK